ncbi:hypothetical protein GGR56DRAFT_618739 [Xylariaceae sp. FL0804]|nr:hypothetical protein GGR56DRAFT_618739 [Xylariaceae sp. FL0804]
MNLGSLFLGFSLAVAVFAAVKGGEQTINTWRRCRRLTPYVVMIWLEWIASLALAGITWSHLRGYLDASFWVWFFILLTWSLQVQFLLQIIINRISLLVDVPGRVRRLKWTVAILITCVNISVFCIWIPARLQISHRYIHINNIWDRIEKSIIAIVDSGLSSYFVYLVRFNLIKNGLGKYKRLYYFNLCMIFVSLSLDVVLIGLMSLPNNLVYEQFHPVAYLLKLVIEMNMAELIGKVAKASNPLGDIGDREVWSQPNLSKGPTATSWFSNATTARHWSTTSDRFSDLWASGCSPNGVTRPQHTALVSVGGYADRQHDVDIELGAIHCRTDTNALVEDSSWNTGTERPSQTPNQDQEQDQDTAMGV